MMPTIKELRAARRLSQYELAQLVGVRPETISAWERGLRTPYDRHLRALAEAFKCPVDEIELVESTTDR